MELGILEQGALFLNWIILNWVELLGWSALIIVTPGLWLQAWKNFRTKSTKDLSLGAYLTLWYGMTAFFILNLVQAGPIQNIINFASGALGASVILLQMRYYQKRKGGEVWKAQELEKKER